MNPSEVTVVLIVIIRKENRVVLKRSPPHLLNKIRNKTRSLEFQQLIICLRKHDKDSVQELQAFDQHCGVGVKET